MKNKKILNIIIFIIFLFAMTTKVDVVKAETADHKFSFTAFTCSTLDENNKCKGYKDDGVIEEFDYDNPFVSHGEVIKLGIHYTPGQNKTWDLSTFFNYDKDYVTPIYVNDSLFIEKAEDLNNLYIIDSNDITTEAQIGAIVEDGSTLEENRTYLENEEDLYYVYFKVKDVTPSNTFKFTYDLDEDKTNVSADGTITSEEIEFEIIDKYTVTYPDGKVIIKNAGDILKLPEAWDKDSEVISTVTFKYHNDLEDTTSNVTKEYTLSKWTIDETEYNPGNEITINNDIVLEDSYEEEIINAEFPENPKKTGFEFDGWYTEETGGEKVESYSEDEDIILHAQWQVMDNVHITTPDGEEEVPYGTEYTLGTNDASKEDTYTVTFKYHDDVTGDLEKEVTVEYLPNGWLVNDVHYDDEASFEVTENATIEPDYIETVIPAEFPSEPTRDNYEFVGWFDAEEDGTEYTEYNEKADITLHARWEITLPTDITIDSEDITLIVGETHQVEVTFTPDGSSDVVTYTGYDSEKISVTEEGLVTGLSKGETTITVGTENTDIEKTITVTILSDKLESEIYRVEDRVRPKENEEDPDITDRIVIGMEVGVTISEFKENMTNPSENIKIYDKDNNLLEDTDIIKSGQIIKLEYNGTVYDEAIMILKGDINGDGLIDVSDRAEVKNHILEITLLEGYKIYSSDIIEDEIIDVSDNSKITDYVLGIIDSLNN